MEEKNIKKIDVDEIKNININIKVTKKVSNWMKEKKYSPTGIFMEAIKELGYK